MGVEYLLAGLAAWLIPMLNARAIAKQILAILIICFLSCLSGFLIAGGHAYGYPGEIYWISEPLHTSFSGDGWAKFSKKLKPDVPRTLPGLTAVGKPARARKGHEAQLSSGDAL
jgi:peptidoglycan/LPS O-acetylase OafA/YrhL